MSIIGRYACFPHGWPGHWASCQHRRQRRSMNFGSGQAVVFLLHCRVAAPVAGPAGVPAAAEGVCIGSVSDRRDLSHPVRRRGTCAPDGACAWISDHTLRLPGGCGRTLCGSRRPDGSAAGAGVEPAHCKGGSGTAAGRTSGATEKAFYWDAFGRRAGQRQDDAASSDRTRTGRDAAASCVVDERCEIFPPGDSEKMPPLDLLSGIPKERAVQMALRTLSPQIILLDELGTLAETAALEQGLYSGVDFVASVHAASVEEAARRPQVQALQRHGMLRVFVLLHGCTAPGKVRQVCTV